MDRKSNRRMHHASKAFIQSSTNSKLQAENYIVSNIYCNNLEINMEIKDGINFCPGKTMVL